MHTTIFPLQPSQLCQRMTSIAFTRLAFSSDFDISSSAGAPAAEAVSEATHIQKAHEVAPGAYRLMAVSNKRQGRWPGALQSGPGMQEEGVNHLPGVLPG